MMFDFWKPLLVFGLCAVGVGLTLFYSKRAGLIDVPNHRSSHTVPTPRGGGIALVVSLFAVVAYEVSRSDQLVRPLLVWLGVALALLTLVGWLDDKGSMPVALRLPVHLGCGIAVALLVNAIAPIPGWVNIAWLVWWVCWTVASINIVNFMDGIDGMVACQGVVYGLFLFALVPSHTLGSRFGLLLAAACFGFLLWNWAPARIFMGDVGSGPLGMFFVIGGALALPSSRPALVFLPLFPLFLDALITLVRRYRRGEKLTAAHRQHLYQRIANGHVGHARVSMAYAFAAAVGAIIAIAVTNAPAPRVAGVITAYLLAIGVTWRIADMKWKGLGLPSIGT